MYFLHILQVLVELCNLWSAGKVKEAMDLQKKVSWPEWGISTSDVNGMKWIIAKERGYPEGCAHPRRPFPKFADPEKQARTVKLVAPLIAVEAQLSKQ